LVKKEEQFECCENERILKTFAAIRNKLQGTGAQSQFVQRTMTPKNAIVKFE